MRLPARFPCYLALAFLISAVPLNSAWALITGGEGNSPLTDPGWPKGAAAIFNHPTRVAWWEGAPFGGGQWHAECRGDAKALNDVLAGFAKLDVKNKRLVVRNGVGHSFWLNPNKEPAKKAAAEVDWTFAVWQPANWERLRKMPRDLDPTAPGDADKGPPALIEIYTGNLNWKEVTVPEGLTVIDDRLEAHGFMPSNGVVLEGNVVDLATQKPLAAKMRLEKVEPQTKGGYKYTKSGEATANEKGRRVLLNAPAGWHRVVIEADGYVPRVVGYGQFDEQPRWHSYNGGLARSAPVSGRVLDSEGKPLAEVTVRLANVAAKVEGRYESPGEYSTQTDADGRFHLAQVPEGKATVWIHKPGYCRPGLGESIATPATDVALSMMKSAQLRVTVDFAGTARPEGYIVHIEPEGGSVVGSWGGSGNIDPKNQISFKDIPPGKYVLHGQPNPGSEKEKSKKITVDLKGGEASELIFPTK